MMKRRFAFMLAALFMLITSFAWGQAKPLIYWIAANQGYENNQIIESVDFDGTLTATFNKGTNSNNVPRYFTTGSSIRCYGGNYFTISTTQGVINEIILSFGTGDGNNVITSDVGVLSNSSNWTGSESSVTFTIGGTSGHRKIAELSITYDTGGVQQTVTMPVFSPAGGTYNEQQNVTISCATDGATIYYTTDGNNPTTSSAVYSSPITISETTTVKAMGVKDGMNNSPVATAVYNFPVVYDNIAAWKAAHTETSQVISGIAGDVTVVYQNGNSLYVQDATAGLLIFGNVNKTYNNGDVISGGIFGTSSLYYGTIEFIPTNSSPFPDGVAGTAIQPTTVTASEIVDNFATYTGRLVKIEGITFDTDHTFATNNSAGRTTTFTQGSTTMTCFDSFKVLGGFEVTAGEGADIIGFVGCYNDTKQIFPRSTDDIIPLVAPTYYNVNIAEGITGGTVTANPTSAAEGATITVTAQPSYGFELATLTYSYPGTTPISIMETMQFVMPAADVTVDATFSDIVVETVATPTFSPAAGTYTEAISVEIACATEGASIYYTTDGMDPGVYPTGIIGTLYVEPVALSENTTLKAFAIKEGMNNSAIATAVYEFQEPAQPTDYTLITHNNALIAGDKYIVVGIKDDSYKALGKQATNNRVAVDVTSVDNVITIVPASTNDDGVFELTLGQENGFWTLYDAVNQGYLYAASSSTNLLKVQAENNANGQWTIDIAADGVATIKAQGENTRNWLRLNNNGSPFSCYASGQLDVYLFKAGEIPTPPAPTYYTVTVAEGITNGIVSVDKTSAAEGETVTVSVVPDGGYELTALTYEYAGTIPVDIMEAMQFTMPAADVTVNAEFGVIANVATPTFSPAAGTYTETISVEIACATEGASIYYTTDGMDPGVYPTGIIGTLYVEPITISETTTVKAFAMKEGLLDSEVATADYTISEPPVPPTPSDYVRITSLSELGNGSKVIFAARFNENANQYYAMAAQASGKPEGFCFTSVMDSDETLPLTLANMDTTYYWTVTTDGINYTFTNAHGEVLGYTSGTNFSAGGNNTAWSITTETSSATAMVPEYSGFVVTNVNNSSRAISLNSFYNFGPYAKSNMTGNTYNFFLDMFATEGGLPVCTPPVFEPGGGVFFDVQEVAITCSTEGATIHYTLDGTDPDSNSAIYTEPINVDESMTIKAIAMKEGYDNSNIATAEYTILLESTTIFQQDWEGDMNGWTFVTVEGGNVWTISQYQGNHYAYCNGYTGGVNEQWCISPAFNLNNFYNAMLSFRNAKNYIGPDLQLFISDDYDGEDPSAATWTELEFTKSAGSFAWAESGVIDLSGYTGANSYIGFKYTSTISSAAAWEVDDIILAGYTTDPTITVFPNDLDGFMYIVGEGPSADMEFHISAVNLTEDMMLTLSSESFEMSLMSGEDFYVMPSISLTPDYGTVEQDIYVRLAADLVPGEYLEVLTISSEIEDIMVNLSGSVVEAGDNWTRIYSLNDIHDGDQVIIASRYDASVGDGYYAMQAGVSGKPEGVLFTSVENEGMEILPAEIASVAATYHWTVTLDGDVITLVNAAGDAIGYNSGTNFWGNVNTEWNIEVATSGENAMVPNHTGFVIYKGSDINRGFAMNATHKFGAYALSNMTNSDYNFVLDLFVLGGSVTPTVSTPVFSMASGTYYEEIEVEITCATEGATIYYTLDGTYPDENSAVYSEPIIVSESMTIYAIAMMEGYESSGLAAASYEIINDIEVIVSEDWEGETNWSFVSVEGNKPWTISTYAGNKYAYANGYGDDVDNEQWCISPAFNLDGRTNHNVTLSFMNAMKFDGPDLEVYFSNDYDGEDPLTATWHELSFIHSEGNYVWTHSGAIPLNSFSGDNCHIGFKYISTVEEGAAAWEVDDILIAADMSGEPYLATTPSVLTGFTHMVGQGPSEAQTFVLTGGNLPEGFLTLTVDDGFEISLDGELYTGVSITIPVDAATLEPTTVWVRLNGEEAGDYEGLITIEDEVITTVALSGSVTADGIAETLTQSVNVWSGRDELVIVNGSDGTLNVVVYNLVGQPVLSETVTTGNNVIRHNLAEGVYIVRIADGKEMTGIKVVVKR